MRDGGSPESASIIPPPSSPGLTRRSIPLRQNRFAKTMDARVKPAHDAATSGLPIALTRPPLPGSNAACSRTSEPLASHNRTRINRIGPWEVRVADDLKIKVNGQISPVAASADTPLLYVLTNELKLWGPRFGCGLAQCGSCSVLADGVEIRSCVTPVGAVAGKSLTTFEGLAALVRATEGTGASAGAASAAAGLHRRAGAAVRLLLQRHDDQGVGAAGADAAPERSADPRPHGRPPLPLRHLSAHHEGDPGCVRHDGGSNAMNAIHTTASPGPLSRRDLLKGGALVVGFCIAGSTLPAAAARGDAAGPPDPTTIDSWIACMPTTPRRSISARASSARATPPACCRSRAKSSIST